MTRWMLLVLLVLLGATPACEDPYEPNFYAICTPKPTNLGVDCTIENKGKQAGRACITVRLTIEGKVPLASRRLCTKALYPGQTMAVSPPFNEGFDRCIKDGRWGCAIEIVETSRSMGENLPKVHTP
jgi:hypothetical protein